MTCLQVTRAEGYYGGYEDGGWVKRRMVEFGGARQAESDGVILGGASQAKADGIIRELLQGGGAAEGPRRRAQITACLRYTRASGKEKGQSALAAAIMHKDFGLASLIVDAALRLGEEAQQDILFGYRHGGRNLLELAASTWLGFTNDVLVAKLPVARLQDLGADIRNWRTVQPHARLRVLVRVIA